MQLDFKSYKAIKTKNYIKKENIYFFFNGVSKNSNNWIGIEQSLKTVNFDYYKIFNQMSRKILNKSLYKNIKWVMNSLTFLIKPKTNQLSKQILIANFESILFNLLAIKINNKVYQMIQLKKNYSLEYQNNKKLIFQFKIINLRKFKLKY